MVNYMLNYIATDTVIYQSEKDDDLYALQVKEWDPVIKWFNERFETDLIKARSIMTVNVTPETKMNISKYFMSYDTPSIHGKSTLIY